MLDYPGKTHRKSSCRHVYFLTTLLLVVYLISGCKPTSSKQLYENPENGVSLEKAKNWDLAFNERNGLIVLEAETGVWDKDSARVEIFAGTCPPDTTNIGGSENSSYEILERDIHRIQILYNLDSVTIVEEPNKIKSGDYEVTKAVIAIPTMSMLDDPARNKVGDPRPDIFQIVDLFVIKDRDSIIMAYVYKGNNEALNAQAQEIVDSIQRTCST